MFDEEAVLVLGAGASRPFGYPIGAELIGNIIRGLQHLPESIEDDAFNENVRHMDFLVEPYRALVTYALIHRPTILPSEFCGSVRPWKALAAELHHTSHQSIDEFARSNPQKNKVVKLLIATEMARHTYENTSLKNKRLEPSSKLTANARQNWYGKLVAQLRRHHRNTRDFLNGHPLSVITFNYDRSLELFLEQELPRAELYADLKWEDAVSVIHVHGEIDFSTSNGSISFTNHFATCLIKSAEKLLVVDDNRESQDPAMTARTILQKADRVVVLGFDFHRPNIDLIGLDDPYVTQRMRVLNYTGLGSFDNRVQRLGVNEDSIFKKGPNFEIASAIDEGIFEF